MTPEETARQYAGSEDDVPYLVSMAKAHGEHSDPRPFELICRTALGQISRTEMMARLVATTFTPGRYDPTGGDGYIRGTWREIESALGLDLITDEEYTLIARLAPSGPPGSGGPAP